MIRSEFLVLIVGMGLVTYIPRWAPLFFLSRRDLPGWFIEWLDLIPVAILTALVVPELLTSGHPRHMDIFQPKLLVALPTFFFALKTKSLAGTVILGMGLFWLSGKLFG
jgi:branched-subunit amino acid transport protein